MSAVKGCDPKLLKQRTLQSAEMLLMEKQSYTWFCKQRMKRLPASNEMIKTKVKELHSILKENKSFIASDGWLKIFKRQFGVYFLKISGEKLSLNTEVVLPFQHKLSQKNKNKNVSREQIYNAGETCLFWKFLPEKSLVMSNEKTTPVWKSEKA